MVDVSMFNLTLALRISRVFTRWEILRTSLGTMASRCHSWHPWHNNLENGVQKTLRE
jgi:hypothetical protein